MTPPTVSVRLPSPLAWALQRKPVTLIAAFKCSDGYVLCADTQATVGLYRVTRQKLATTTCGNFQIAIAGSGNNGNLIDTFVERLQDNLRDNNRVWELGELKKFISQG